MRSEASGGEGRIRTFVGVSRQIYSLFPLTAREPPPTNSLAQSFAPPPPPPATSRPCRRGKLATGLEPITPSLQVRSSTIELRQQTWLVAERAWRLLRARGETRLVRDPSSEAPLRRDVKPRQRECAHSLACLRSPIKPNRSRTCERAGSRPSMDVKRVNVDGADLRTALERPPPKRRTRARRVACAKPEELRGEPPGCQGGPAIFMSGQDGSRFSGPVRH